VYICGNYSSGILARGDSPTAIEPFFMKADELKDIKHILIGGNANYPIAMALNETGNIYAWGYNGNLNGQCLVNETVSDYIKTPTLCYNYETKSPVNDAIYIYTNDNAPQNQAQFACLDAKGSLYIGGFSTEADIPDFNQNIPYYRKYNMRNIAFDVNISGSDALIHRNNGTVYMINRYGPRKLF
jgi:hypothetical protein